MEDQKDINTAAPPIAKSLPQLPCALRCVLFESALHRQMVLSCPAAFLSDHNIYLLLSLVLKKNAGLSESDKGKNWGLD